MASKDPAELIAKRWDVSAEACAARGGSSVPKPKKSRFVRLLEAAAPPEKKFLVRTYKSTWSMQSDLNRLAAKGWIAKQTTAAPGFLTGTRSYTVTFERQP